MAELDIGQAAAAIGENGYNIRYAIKRGQLPAVRRGIKLFVKLEDLEVWYRERMDRRSYNGTIPVESIVNIESLE